jgi:FMN-dependent oxidoreductase (nitrilotriacetate monooxygenase family)
MGPHYPDIGLFEDTARLAERGMFDLLFFGDSTGIPNTWEGGIDAAVRRGVAWPRMDMSPWIAAMSRVTSHLGFGLTYASTFMHPYYVARLLNSLDHLTNGRIAFNVITSQRRADAENYGFDELMEHGTRYDRMEEFIDVCRALWTSVDADAFVWDRTAGIVADPAKVRAINHAGRFFKVKGPLSVPPSPQGQPVLIQAGGSPRGIRAAAHFVDHVFGASKSRALMAEQRRDLDAALVAEGRDPAAVGIIWATKLIVAQTRREAEAMRERIIADVPQEAVGVWLSHNTGFDMSTLPPRFSLRLPAWLRRPAGARARRVDGADAGGIFRPRPACRDGLHRNPSRHRRRTGRLPGRIVRGVRQPRRLHDRPLASRPARAAAEHRRPTGPRTATSRTRANLLRGPDAARKSGIVTSTESRP